MPTISLLSGHAFPPFTSPGMAQLKNELTRKDAALRKASETLQREQVERERLQAVASSLRARLADAEAAKRLNQEVMHQHLLGLGGSGDRSDGNGGDTGMAATFQTPHALRPAAPAAAPHRSRLQT